MVYSWVPKWDERIIAERFRRWHQFFWLPSCDRGFISNLICKLEPKLVPTNSQWSDNRPNRVDQNNLRSVHENHNDTAGLAGNAKKATFYRWGHMSALFDDHPSICEVPRGSGALWHLPLQATRWQQATSRQLLLNLCSCLIRCDQCLMPAEILQLALAVAPSCAPAPEGDTNQR